MISEIQTCEDRKVKIEGPVASGKTEALIRRCALLLSRDTDPSSIAVITCTSFAAQAFKKRLESCLLPELKPAASKIFAGTALELCLSTLALPEIEAATERKAKLISKYEYNFILEDMKTLGMSHRELRGMLGFFYRNWASLTPKKDWCFGDALTVCGKLQGMAALLGGIFEQEAAALCVDALTDEKTKDFRGRFAYVLCDDFQNLSKAEQNAVCLHAEKQIMICGNVNQVTKTTSDYPNAEGFSTFDTLRKNVTVFKLTQAYGNTHIQKLANNLCEYGSMQTDFQAESFAPLSTNDASVSTTDANSEAEVLRIKWADPKDELLGLTKKLRHDFDQQSKRCEHDTCIVVPNKRWARMYENALQKRGFKTVSTGLGTALAGDPRDTRSCPAFLAYIKLNLLAKPQDAMAWRAWCGFDDYLTNSQSWEGMYAYAAKHGRDLVECLEEVSENVLAGGAEPFLRASVLAKRFAAGKQFIEQNQARKGFALLNALQASGLPEFADLEACMTGEETAEELYAFMYRWLNFPVIPEDIHALHINSYSNMCGLNYEYVIAPGLVDGFMPTRAAFEVVSTEEDRQNAMDAERRAFYGMCGKAQKELVFSYFSKSELELAERTKMQVSRIRSEGDERIALSRPSVFFDELGSYCPGSISGQAYLAEDLLS